MAIPKETQMNSTQLLLCPFNNGHQIHSSFFFFPWPYLQISTPTKPIFLLRSSSHQTKAFSLQTSCKFRYFYLLLFASICICICNSLLLFLGSFSFSFFSGFILMGFGKVVMLFFRWWRCRNQEGREEEVYNQRTRARAVLADSRGEGRGESYEDSSSLYHHLRHVDSIRHLSHSFCQWLG